jgi:hypothetical protein
MVEFELYLEIVDFTHLKNILLALTLAQFDFPIN